MSMTLLIQNHPSHPPLYMSCSTNCPQRKCSDDTTANNKTTEQKGQKLKLCRHYCDFDGAVYNLSHCKLNT